MIFWKYVKGLSENNSEAALYTFLLFQSQRTPSDLTHFKHTPILKYSTTSNPTSNLLNPTDGTNSWGHIITQNATNQKIETAFTFTKCVSFTNTTSGENSIDVSGTSKFQNDIYLTKGKAFYFDAPTYNAYINANSNNTLIVKSAGILYLASAGSNAIEFWQGSTKRAEFVSSGLNVTGDMTCTNKCEATYFNATSDKRAKTNLKPLSINALDLVKRVQLYSFKYKDSDLPSIGILAQDVQDVNIEGFDLVDNKEASGVDMDYMSIHESKLTYILWKAIQEQQKEIEELKTQIKNLTK